MTGDLNATNGTLGGFLDAKPRKLVKKGGSASVAGDKMAEKGEIYIRADGKKVRRVKKAVSKRDLNSNSDDDGGSVATAPALAASSAAAAIKPKKKLGDVLGAPATTATTTRRKVSGAASVAGDRPTHSKTEVGEVYIRADGKKVRRVKKSSVDAAAATATPTTPAAASKPSLSAMLESAPSPHKKSGAASVSGGTVTTTEVYINAQGKKVRRVKKVPNRAAGSSAATVAPAGPATDSTPPTPTSAGTSGLAGFLESPTPGAKTKVKGSSLSVDGGTAVKTEIYIRPDGKKVRRVKKVAAGSSASVAPTPTPPPPEPAAAKKTLDSVLGASSKKATKSGAATVAGDRLRGQKLDADDPAAGEVYIRADGKKVRRVKKSAKAAAAAPATPVAPSAAATAAATTEAAEAKKSALANMLESSPAGKRGAASVAGLPATQGGAEGEIYINKDGKKVRRVRRSKGGAMTRQNSSTALTTPRTSAASVTGAMTPTTASKKAAASAEGEIYIRADGKKVRRVKKATAASKAATANSAAGDLFTPATAAAAEDAEKKKKSLGGFLDSTRSGKGAKGGAATVAGDRVAAKTTSATSTTTTTKTKKTIPPDGEIVIRADGKKVLRRKKQPTDGASVASTTSKTEGGAADGKPQKEYEVVRRADGKLVRRVKRAVPKASAAGDLAGFLETSQKSAPSKKSGGATVSGEVVVKTPQVPPPAAPVVPPPAPKPPTPPPIAAPAPAKPPTPVTVPTPSPPAPVVAKQEEVQVSKELEALIKPQGLGDMWLSKDVKDKKPREPSADDIAAPYRKMQEMGLADEVVRHRMMQDGVDAKIIASVVGEVPAPTPAVETPAQQPAKETEEKPSLRNSAARTIQLTMEENSIAADYRKLLRMGLSEDAVRLKMNQDGVDDKIISSVLGDHWTPPANAVPSKAAAATPAPADNDEEEAEKDTKETAPEPVKPQPAVLKKPEPVKPASVFLNQTEPPKPFSFNKKPVAQEPSQPSKAVVPKPSEQESKPPSPKPVVEEPVEEAPKQEVKPLKPSVPPDTTKEPAEEEPQPIVQEKAQTESSTPSEPAKPTTPKTEVQETPVQEPTVPKAAPAPAQEAVPPTPAVPPVKSSMPTPTPEPEQPEPEQPEPEQPEPEQQVAAKAVPTIELSEEDEEIASRYRKMMKMGLPDDVVRHKMSQDEVEDKIVAAVLGDEWSPPAAETPVASPVEETSAPAPEAEQAQQQEHEPDPVGETPSAASAIQLSEEEEETASRYRKMLKMGLVDEVVRHKMTQDEIDAKIMAAVLGDEWTPAVEAVSAPEPEPEPVAEETSPASAIELTEEEEVEASRYRKMLKMGLPDDVVRHKMTQDEVDAKIIAAVLGDAWEPPAQEAPEEPEEEPAVEETPESTAAIELTEDEEAVAAKYRKMQKMGLPDDVVRHKMSQDEVDGKIFAALFGDEWTPPETDGDGDGETADDDEEPAASAVELTEDEETVASKYRKMLNMGLPDEVVRHKMTQDEVDAKIFAAVLGDPWEPQETTEREEPEDDADEKAAAPAIELTEEEEEVASKYRKMLKMMLPEEVVRHKMTQDEVDARIVAAVLGDEWTPPAESAPNTTAGAAAPAAQLSEEEEDFASKYRKMLKMGLPDDVVRHKMTQDGADEKILAAVLGDGDDSHDAQTGSHQAAPAVALPPPPPLEPAQTPESPGKTSNSAAYIVVVSDEQKPTSPPKPKRAPLNLPGPPIGTSTQDADEETVTTVDPKEKFAVKVETPRKKKKDGVSMSPVPAATTRFMTLGEIAKMTGQSIAQLENIVNEKRERAASPPRFVLQAMDKPPPKEEVFEVEVPLPQAHSAPVALSPSRAGAGPSSQKEVKEGQEVVDSALATAARQVSALGSSDVASLLAKLKQGDIGELIAKLQEAEKRQKKLEKQLQQAGVAIAEDIEYKEALEQVGKIAKRMGEIGGSDVTVEDKELQAKLREEYFKLEQEMERYNTALMLTEEYQAEQDRVEKKWENDNWDANVEALKKIRRHMPVMIRHMSEAELTNTPSPNGKFIPKAIAKKFKRTNVLQCIRLNPDDLERMHPSTLENMRVTGLTLTERRALYAHLKVLGPRWEKNKAEKMTERKWTWYQMMKNNFKENLAPYQRHVDQYGPPENHPYATRENPNVGCPLIGKQCPIKADLVLDYNGDYGYPDGAEYEVSDVKKADVDDPGAKAMAEAAELAKVKKANERADILKKHYKGKLLQVSKANGSCESMDEAMDKMENHLMKWIEKVLEKGDNATEDDNKKMVSMFTEALNELKLAVLDFAQRSGMQISGKKKAGGDAPDIRSSVEASLSEEVFECSGEFFRFILDRMKATNIKDTRVTKTIELLQGMLNELHEKNLAKLTDLGVKRGDRSRKFKKTDDLKKEVEERMKPKEEEAPAEAAAAPAGLPPQAGRGGGRGDLLSALAGRGRGRGRGGDKGGRGDLLSAISGRGRGRGRGGGGNDGGRGGLLAAIQGRGGGGDGGGDGGGRGGLLAAIQGRGKGKGPPAGGGGRAGLLAAIAARGGGD